MELDDDETLDILDDYIDNIKYCSNRFGYGELIYLLIVFLIQIVLSNC